MSDWLPEDHLAWFILDLVAELDLAELYVSLRADGRGGASYHAEMMLGVLLYAYYVGERSSRRIERRLIEDVAFRVVVPPPVHAGGLRSHAISPLISYLYNQGQLEAVAHPQTAVFEAAIQFARAEEVPPAPESAHAVRSAIDEALEARGSGEERVILFNLSGHGYFDMQAYVEYLSGRMEDRVASEDELRRARESIPRPAAI